ncbi:Fur family transcriptional regulator [Rhodococcoides kyotonense]|uniref:Fur family transcriptional regulator, ferric uptake regulator n=1 Tax=Rhodococcoides kyotonense TaxID=398843 RepID=A0A239F6P5_9NOCA|nr:Fur family transcriptional regulator [Rhodococcus kyotonensis]SNS51764.1 Fur family transcriptional regulator, ferric uptake regulator [Rhodococcus kyotonensis]
MPKDDVTTEPAALLRSVGLRVTGPRVAVLSAVAARPHSDADDVAAVVRADVGSVSTQAVYDVLRACVNAGLLRRIEPAGSPALYETRIGDNHHHLVCRKCQTVVDVDCAIGAAPCLDPSDSHGFVVEEAEIVFWGLCSECVSTHSSPVPGARTP